MDLKFVDRNGRQSIKEIDKAIKNKFKWSWLEEKDANGDFFSDYIRKVSQAGVAWCIPCNTKILYGSSGKKVFHVHAKRTEHGKARRAAKYSQSLPSVIAATKSMKDCSCTTGAPQSQTQRSLPYGASQNIEQFVKNHSTEPTPAPQRIPVSLAFESDYIKLEKMSEEVRPFKVWNSDRTVKKSVAASSLGNLIKKGCDKLGLAGNPRVVLETDGTEVDDEDYFSFVPDNSTFMLLREGEQWQPAGKEDVARDETDHASMGVGELDQQTAVLVQGLRRDLSRIITFSSDQLQHLVDCETSALAQQLGEGERFARSLQEACQRHLDDRSEASETAGLLRLYHKAYRDSQDQDMGDRGQDDRVGRKRKTPADDG